MLEVGRGLALPSRVDGAPARRDELLAWDRFPDRDAILDREAFPVRDTFLERDACPEWDSVPARDALSVSCAVLDCCDVSVVVVVVGGALSDRVALSSVAWSLPLSTSACCLFSALSLSGTLSNCLPVPEREAESVWETLPDLDVARLPAADEDCADCFPDRSMRVPGRTEGPLPLVPACVPARVPVRVPARVPECWLVCVTMDLAPVPDILN